jgi:hypothetical protein
MVASVLQCSCSKGNKLVGIFSCLCPLHCPCYMHYVMCQSWTPGLQIFNHCCFSLYKVVMLVELSDTAITCIVSSCMVNGDAINLPRVKMVIICKPVVDLTSIWWSEQKTCLCLIIATILPEITWNVSCHEINDRSPWSTLCYAPAIVK